MDRPLSAFIVAAVVVLAACGSTPSAGSPPPSSAAVSQQAASATPTASASTFANLAGWRFDPAMVTPLFGDAPYERYRTNVTDVGVWVGSSTAKADALVTAGLKDFNYNAYRITGQSCPMICVVQVSVFRFSDVAAARAGFDYLKADTRRNIPAGKVRDVSLGESWDDRDDLIVGPFGDGATWAAFMGRVKNVLVFHADGGIDDATFSAATLQAIAASIDAVRKALAKAG